MLYNSRYISQDAQVQAQWEGALDRSPPLSRKHHDHNHIRIRKPPAPAPATDNISIKLYDTLWPSQYASYLSSVHQSNARRPT